MDNTHEWCAAGVEPQIDKLKNIILDEELPWFAEHIRRREIFHVNDPAALPSEAMLERKHFEDQKIQSLVVVPMETKEKLIGFLGFDSVRERHSWNDDDKSLLRFFGNTLSHVIERKKAEDALREDQGYWNQLESYIHDRTDARFSHGICPECAKKLYPDLNIRDE